MTGRKAQLAAVIMLVTTMAGCLERETPVVNGSVPEPTAALQRIPFDHPLQLFSSIPDGGWALWLWKNDPGGLNGQDSVWTAYDIDVTPLKASASPFWAAAYFVRLPENYTGTHVEAFGPSDYRSSAGFARSPLAQWSSTFPSRAMATQGILVLSERAATIRGNVSRGDGPTTLLNPVATGYGLGVQTLPISDVAETLPATERIVRTSVDSFPGGFSAVTAFADSPPPYAHAASGEFRVRFPDGQERNRSISGGIPFREDTRQCLDIEGTPQIPPPEVCRVAYSQPDFLGAGCQPAGSVDATATFTARQPVRYVPVIFAVPVDFCHWGIGSS
jgi:hypothetical protein